MDMSTSWILEKWGLRGVSAARVRRVIHFYMRGALLRNEKEKNEGARAIQISPECARKRSLSLSLTRDGGGELTYISAMYTWIPLMQPLHTFGVEKIERTR